ncbi:hypothetical protein PanWU01x14_017290 [Parasponia andersonii]|uniref:Retrotransposon Copia-like N-terminal domain-containing protein n=1 Tax=Parasponia andersonii TaxID=3476 RepID=A0A2P5DZY5_PARAD|nr:hypothetical protein PanWU01x14_017290 [Parasponia andersonii]
MASSSSVVSSSSTSAPSARASLSAVAIPNILNPLHLRLDRNNYAYWRSQVLEAVRAHDLDDFLFSTRLRPDAFIPDPANPHQSINNPDHAIWIRLD